MAKGADTRSICSTCASFVDFDHDDYVVPLPFWYLSTGRISRLTVILLPDHIIFEPSSDSSIIPDIILHLPWRGKQVDNKVCTQRLFDPSKG